MFKCCIFFIFIISSSLFASSSSDKSLLSRWFSPHYQNYFITGSDTDPYGNQVKFQFSMAAPLLRKDIAKTNLVGAYTQRSFFDLYNTEYSSPIYDSSYMPEVFLRHFSDYIPFFKPTFSLGLKHHSNGGGVSNSRNWGTRIHFTTSFSWNPITILFRSWGNPIENKALTDNQDIDTYFGNYDVFLRGCVKSSIRKPPKHNPNHTKLQERFRRLNRKFIILT